MFGRKECKEMSDYYLFRAVKDSLFRLQLVTKREDIEVLKMLELGGEEISVSALGGQPEAKDIVKYEADDKSRIRLLRNIQSRKIYLHKLDEKGNVFVADISETYFGRKSVRYRELERKLPKRVAFLPYIFFDYCLLYPLSKGIDNMCSALIYVFAKSFSGEKRT